MKENVQKSYQNSLTSLLFESMNPNEKLHVTIIFWVILALLGTSYDLGWLLCPHASPNLFLVLLKLQTANSISVLKEGVKCFNKIGITLSACCTMDTRWATDEGMLQNRR